MKTFIKCVLLGFVISGILAPITGTIIYIAQRIGNK